MNLVTVLVEVGPVPSNSKVAVLLSIDTTSCPPLIACTEHTLLSENRNKTTMNACFTVCGYVKLNDNNAA